MHWQAFATAPRDGTPFLAAWVGAGPNGYLVQPVRWQNGHFLHTWDHAALTGEPTHRMPMPAPPQDLNPSQTPADQMPHGKP